MESLGRLTPASLTSALHRSGVLQEATVVDVKVERIGEDLGFNGILWRVSPTYDFLESQAPRTLIAKFPQDSSVTEKLQKESLFYREFQTSVGIRIPHAYVAVEELLLLEDLSPLKCGNVAAGCTGDEAQLIVRHLARFHATNWESSKILQHDWLPSWPIHPKRFLNRLRDAHPVFLERFGSHLSDPMRLLTVRLIEKIPLVVKRLQQAPSTLIHVDTHLDNIFYEMPDTVVLIDWPSAVVGPAIIDLSRFLTLSLSASVRQSVEEEILTEYLLILSEGGVEEYSQSEMLHHLQLASLRWWAGMVTGFGASHPEQLGGRQAELQKVEIERMSVVAHDWELAQFLDQV